MLRVLVNQVSAIPGKTTGLSSYAWHIVEALSSTGKASYTLATTWPVDALPRSLVQTGIEVVSLANFRNEVLSCAYNNFRIPSLAQTLGSDIVFSPQPFGVLLGGKARVVVVHDLYRVTHPRLHSFWRRAQWNAVMPSMLRRSNAVVCVSNATQVALLKHYPSIAHKSFVVGEAGTLPLVGEVGTPKIDQTLSFGITVSTTSPLKNIASMVRALKRLSQRGIVAPLYFIGEDPNNELKALASAASVKVHATGFISEPDLRAYYRRASFYLNTSVSEGFCLPILDAQAFGVPVICSDLPVLREVAGEGAVFINPSEPDGIADAIERVMSDAKFRDLLIRQGLKNAESYSWMKSAAQLEKVFDSALGAKQEVQSSRCSRQVSTSRENV